MQLPNTQPIVNGPRVDFSTLVRWLDRRSTHLSSAQRVRIADAYTVCGHLTSIGNLLPFAQALHETGHFTSARWLQSNNAAGIGATDDGAWGGVFGTPEAGILAQFCHLLCYTTPTSNTLYDKLARLSPRHDAMARAYGRGVAPQWRQLHRRWNSPYAPDTDAANYGLRILRIAEQVAG
jgi:N-acetylmuramoyl-L-alanine amidase